ncbi:MAG: hypothetical protein WCI49_03560 [Ferruginibacter sp.]
MSHHHKQEAQQLKPYKLLAQTAGLAVSVFVVFFAIGEVLPAIKKDESTDISKFLPLVLVLLPVSGYVISWFKELAGAVIMLLGGVILCMYYVIEANAGMALLYGVPFIVTGALYLLHISRRNKLKQKK